MNLTVKEGGVLVKRKILLILSSLMLIFCVTACSKQTDSSTANEPEASQTEEEKGFDMERIRKSIVIKGQTFEIPTPLADLGEEWTWKEHENSYWGTDGNGLVYLYYKGEEWFIATVHNYYEGSENEGIIYNLTIDTSDCSIDGLVPLESTRQDVVDKYGEPVEIFTRTGDYPHFYRYGTIDHDAGLGPMKQQGLSMGIDENDIVTEVSITYYVEPENN